MYIYKITNLINDKIYIGRTIQSWKTRWSQHKSRGRSTNNIKHSHKLYHDMKVFGVDRFICEPIFTATTFEELCTMERTLISQYNSIDTGYNLVYGDIIINKNMDDVEASKVKEVVSIGVKGYWNTKTKDERVIIAQKTMHSISFEDRQQYIKDTWSVMLPEDKKKRAKKTLDKRRANNTTGMYTMISPDGVRYEHINDLTSFCTQHNLKRNCIYHIIRGRCKQHKGWSLVIERPPIRPNHKEYTFISPSGDEVRTNNLSNFCKLYELCRGSITCIIRGPCKQHKGWVLKK